MMRTVLLTIILLNLSTVVFAKRGPSSFMDSTIIEQSDSSFMASFPFENYAGALKGQPLSYLVNDILFLKHHNKPFNDFLDEIHALFLKEIDATPKSYENLNQLVRLGEGLMHLDDISINSFPAFGDLLLQSISTQLDKGLEEGLYSIEEKDVAYLVRRLKENQFFVSIPVSDWDKGFGHLKRGELGYLFRKVRLKQPILFYATMALGLFLIGYLFYFGYRRISGNTHS